MPMVLVKELSNMRQKGKENCQKIIDFVRRYNSEQGCAPTLKDISRELYGHERNAGNLEKNIKELVDAGFLYRGEKGSMRTLRLVMPQPRPWFYKAGE
jgi:hypothetical protein